jgi:hypothetical protein
MDLRQDSDLRGLRNSALAIITSGEIAMPTRRKRSPNRTEAFLICSWKSVLHVSIPFTWWPEQRYLKEHDCTKNQQCQ